MVNLRALIPPAAHDQRLGKGRLSGCVCVDVVSPFITYSFEDRQEAANSCVLLSKPGLFRLRGRLEALIALKNKLYPEKSVLKQGIMGRQLCLFLITSVTCQLYNEVLF